MPRLITVGALGALIGAAAAPAALAQDTRTPAAIALQTGLERLCLPVLQGAQVGAAAKTAGARLREGGWWIAAAGPVGVSVTPPSPVNPTVCTLRVNFPAGKGQPLFDLLDRWSAARGLHRVKDQQASRGPSRARVTSSWEGSSGGARLAVVLARELTLAGAPVNGAYGEATVLVSRS